MSLFKELKRRNVFRVGIAYVLMGWVLLQGADFAFDLIGAPNWVIQSLSVVVVIGLPIALFFAWAFEMTPEGIKREHEVDRSQSITPKTGRKLDYAIIGLLAIATTYLLLDKFVYSESTVATDDAIVVEETVIETDTKSIAVLPFTNMSQDTSNEFFSDGISEEILNSLARVKELKVAGRTSSFAFKGRNEDLRLIGETLGVNHILEGSVRKSGNTVRITAQLVQVSDGFHLWSDTYDRELTDIFAIQDEIADAILNELKATLIGEEQVASARTDPELYERYLLAKQRIYSRNGAQLENAVQLLDEVLAEDPGFAPAWAQRGIATLMLSDNNYGTTPHEDAVTQSRRYIDRSLELDDGLVEGWAARGLSYNQAISSEEAKKAEAPLRRALEINPSLINASNWLQINLTRQDRVAESVAILEDMFARDPLFPPASGNLVFLYIRMGEQAKAQAVVDFLRPFQAEDPNLASNEAGIAFFRGELAEALTLNTRALESAPQNQNIVFFQALLSFSLADYSQVLALDVTDPFFRIRALKRLHATEEATMLARDFAGENPMYLIQLVIEDGRYGEAVQMIEERWADLAILDAHYGGGFGFGYWEMLWVAKAYLEAGEAEKFQSAMALVRETHDQHREQGADTPFFDVMEAGYWTLAGDTDQAIDFVERAVASGYTGSPRISDEFMLLRPLEGEPRYEAAQSAMLEHLDRQRAELGWGKYYPGIEL
jgi:TolB-like protein